MPEPQTEVQTVEKHILELMREFDTVQIFATRHEGEKGTIRLQMGRGNWFARYGHIKLWVDSQILENLPTEGE